MNARSEDPRLDKLLDFVVRLAAGDLAGRLELSPAADSVDAAAMGLNMLAEELQVLYAGLEQHVAERTAQLERAQAELRRMALSDPLTGLANRTLFGDRIGQALARTERGGQPPAVLVLDLDGFKAINDGLGHAGGDSVLVEVGRRLQALARKTDTVSRFGGDEFAILITDATADAALRIADRVLHGLRRPFKVAGQSTSAGASVGVCFGSRGQSAESLLRDADTAMYVAKSRGRNNIQIFTPEIHAAAIARLELTRELQVALTAKQFVLYYQPFVELATGRIVGAEALVRWRHPQRGLVLPEEFIHVAEETGLIIEIGQWVTVEAVRQLGEWQRKELLPQQFRLHVNIPPVHFRSPGIVPFVVGVLERYDVPAARLVLEITETGLMTDEAEIVQTLQDLRSVGVGLAIDDFGTGYSSISYLRRLPVDTVKIDRSLVTGIDSDPQQHRLAAAILQLIEAVSLTAVAEGVETAAQATQLHTLGCRYGQGFRWGRPVPGEGMTELLRVGFAEAAGPQPTAIQR